MPAVPTSLSTILNVWYIVCEGFPPAYFIISCRGPFFALSSNVTTLACSLLRSDSPFAQSNDHTTRALLELPFAADCCLPAVFCCTTPGRRFNIIAFAVQVRRSRYIVLVPANHAYLQGTILRSSHHVRWT